MEWSPFRLLIAAIAAAMFLFLALQFFSPAKQDIIVELNKGLDYSEANEGALHETTLNMTTGFAVQGKSFDSATRNVRFECTSGNTCTGNRIEVEARSFVVHEDFPTSAYFRCKQKGALSDCVVYFGDEPAKLEVRLVQAPTSVSAGETTAIAFIAENNGKLTAIDTWYYIRVFLKKQEGFEDVLALQKEFFGRLPDLESGRTNTVIQEFELEASGTHLLEITVEGEDAGIYRIRQEFSVIGGANLECTATMEGRTFLEGNNCRTELLCEHCSLASECAAKWDERGTENVELGSKEKAYSDAPSIDGQCG